MLAKTWKTILLAICIIAVLFNIISKLVRTPSFQKNLDAVLEENIVTVDTAQISNSIESAGQAIKDTAAELSDTIFNGTTEDVVITTNSDTEEDTNTDVVYEEENTEDEFNSTTSDETTNSSNSKFKVSFN